MRASRGVVRRSAVNPFLGPFAPSDHCFESLPQATSQLFDIGLPVQRPLKLHVGTCHACQGLPSLVLNCLCVTGDLLDLQLEVYVGGACD